MKKTIITLLGIALLLMIPVNSWAQTSFKNTLKTAKKGDAVAKIERE